MFLFSLIPPPTPDLAFISDEDPVWAKYVKLEDDDDYSKEEKPIVDEDMDVKQMKRLKLLESKMSSLKNETIDISSQRKNRVHNDTPSPRASRSGREVADSSPPRKQKRYTTPSSEPETRRNLDISPPRAQSPDMSAPWRVKCAACDGDADLSLPRKGRKDRDTEAVWKSFKDTDHLDTGRGAACVYQENVTGKKISKEHFLKANKKKEEKPFSQKIILISEDESESVSVSDTPKLSNIKTKSPHISPPPINPHYHIHTKNASFDKVNFFNHDSYKVYMGYINSNKSIANGDAIDWAFFDKNKDLNIDWFVQEQGWSRFLHIKEKTYPDIIYTFYANLSKFLDTSDELVYRTKARGVELEFGYSNILEILGLDDDGAEFHVSSCDNELKLKPGTVHKAIYVPGTPIPKKGMADAVYLRFDCKIIHTFIIHCIYPTISSFGFVSHQTAWLIYCVYTHRKVNTYKIFTEYMWGNRNKGSLPYGMTLSYLLLKMGVKPEPGEASLQVDKKMGLNKRKLTAMKIKKKDDGFWYWNEFQVTDPTLNFDPYVDYSTDYPPPIKAFSKNRARDNVRGRKERGESTIRVEPKKKYEKFLDYFNVIVANQTKLSEQNKLIYQAIKSNAPLPEGIFEMSPLVAPSPEILAYFDDDGGDEIDEIQNEGSDDEVELEDDSGINTDEE